MAIQIAPEERDLARFNQAIRQLVEGRMNAVGDLTLEVGAAVTVVPWPNCSTDSRIFLMPQTAAAAAEMTSTYISASEIVQGQFTVRHANNATVGRIFSFLCIGG